MHFYSIGEHEAALCLLQANVVSFKMNKSWIIDKKITLRPLLICCRYFFILSFKDLKGTKHVINNYCLTDWQSPRTWNSWICFLVIPVPALAWDCWQCQLYKPTFLGLSHVWLTPLPGWYRFYQIQFDKREKKVNTVVCLLPQFIKSAMYTLSYLETTNQVLYLNL